MPRRNAPSATPRVLGPGQGVLPLAPRGDDFYGPIGTGMRGQGPDVAPGVTPFEQTGYDLGNLWEHGTTMPHWSENQMRKMYGVPLLRAAFNQDETRRAITASEIDRMLRNVGTGIGDYAGQLIPNIFGGGGAQYSLPPGQIEPRRIEFDKLFPDAPKRVPPGTVNPDNLIRPKVPGYPTTDPTAGGLGGPFVPGPGNPSYPPAQAQQDRIFNKCREMKAQIKDWLRRRRERREMRVDPARFEA